MREIKEIPPVEMAWCQRSGSPSEPSATVARNTDRVPPETSRIVDWLTASAVQGKAGGAIKTIETHGAIVVLTDTLAIKVKRPVRFDYMEFSTLDLREQALRRELEINRGNAPGIYLDVVAITERSDGSLAFGGPGTAVEWALRMKRFPDGALLADLAGNNTLTPTLVDALTEAVLASHQRGQSAPAKNTIAQLGAIIDSIGRELRRWCPATMHLEITTLLARMRAHLAAAAPVLRRRSAAGLVRHVHADLHLGNVVLWNGTPTLFDALEFDEQLATIDLLYDLAFLLMDLDHRGERRAANRLLSRYLWRTQQQLDLYGLAALPVFLAVRAGIRAMVRAARAAQEAAERQQVTAAEAQGYLDRAAGYLALSPPRLVSIGGLSGTGKSTLAADISPLIGRAPGAVHLRTDLERKALAGVGETERLPVEAYTAETSARVYAHTLARADAIIAAGHSVVVDGVFSTAGERTAIETIAKRHRASFRGLWLSAPVDLLRSRIAGRTGDASDATVEVVDQQIARPTGGITWTSIDAAGSADQTLAMACSALNLPNKS
jgi:hypothetical protein